MELVEAVAVASIRRSSARVAIPRSTLKVKGPARAKGRILSIQEIRMNRINLLFPPFRQWLPLNILAILYSLLQLNLPGVSTTYLILLL